MQQQWIDANSPTGCRHGSMGLSPGLKNMSRACFLPRLRRDRPRPGPFGVPKKERLSPLLFCIWAHILIKFCKGVHSHPKGDHFSAGGSLILIRTSRKTRCKAITFPKHHLPKMLTILMDYIVNSKFRRISILIHNHSTGISL